MKCSNESCADFKWDGKTNCNSEFPMEDCDEYYYTPAPAKCTTIECYSKAVTKCPDTGRVHCLKCSIKIAESFGAGSVEPLAGAKLPWEDDRLHKCSHCGTEYSLYLIGHTGDCPKCRKPLPKEILNAS